MTGGALPCRVFAVQLSFALGTAFLGALLAPRLLLLDAGDAAAAGLRVFVAIAAGGGLGAFQSAFLLQRHRALLEAIDAGSPVTTADVGKLAGEHVRVSLGWLILPALGLAVATIWFRPVALSSATMVAVVLLAAVIVAAATLPLTVVLRSSFAGIFELIDPAVCQGLLEQTETARLPRNQLTRRLVASVLTPVAFVAFGSALIANAHLRRDDRQEREETARAVALAALEPRQDAPNDTAAVLAAVRQAEGLGLAPTQLKKATKRSMAQRGPQRVRVPLRQGAVTLTIEGAARTTDGADLVIINLLALTVAALAGMLLGRALADDLDLATRGIRLLSTASAGKRDATPRAARFVVVSELAREVERLAGRFRVFSKAQERAIKARAAASRMRGLFFASVSHDLKSPLNAILGFAEIVRHTEALSAGQLESLDQIGRSGRELLALIETILDAARVEAGQLELVMEPVPFPTLIRAALEKGRDLGGQRDVEVVGELVEAIPVVTLDEKRISQALATLLGHAIRSAEEGTVLMRLGRHGRDRFRVDVHIPGHAFSARKLRAMLNPRPGDSEHRGLALALGLARSVIALHGGQVEVTSGPRGPVFVTIVPVECQVTHAPDILDVLEAAVARERREGSRRARLRRSQPRNPIPSRK